MQPDHCIQMALALTLQPETAAGTLVDQTTLFASHGAQETSKAIFPLLKATAQRCVLGRMAPYTKAAALLLLCALARAAATGALFLCMTLPSLLVCHLPVRFRPRPPAPNILDVRSTGRRRLANTD